MRSITLLVLTASLTAVGGAASDAPAILWQAPGSITIQDWIWGPGGEDRAPKPPFEFIEEDLNGTNPKIKVRDARGAHWIVKFGGENHSEVFASRLLHASGYVAEPDYYVRAGAISGAHNLKRTKPFLGKNGAFQSARFKLHDKKTMARAEGRAWSWNANPFVGTEELSGLKILLMLTSNWDGKDARDGRGSNTAVYSKQDGDNLYYAFDDWGATMGKWGGFFQRDKWNPAGYEQQTRTFVRAAPGGKIEWGYRGKHNQDITSGITGAHISWLMTYLTRVTDDELRAGLRASGATGAAIEIYTRCLRERIMQLERVSGPAGSTASARLAKE
jgi:hypothetical protein